jgi:hypothetical protein
MERGAESGCCERSKWLMPSLLRGIENSSEKFLLRLFALCYEPK